MILARRYNMHRCNACRAIMQDCDFVRFGIALMPRLQMYFDYFCPKCAHHGRYVVLVPAAKTTGEALVFLSSCIDDADEQKTPQIDWDRVFGEPY